MGVPALFRWLSKKYPKIVQSVVEEEPTTIRAGEGDEQEVPVDTSGPNPNGVEFDNLYLDMNGIVHPCTHPEGKPAPKTEEDMMHEVFLYTGRVVSMIRPRKLLFMAIDGVAPRAKMNQQRSRRFRAAQEAKVKAEEREAAIAEWEAMGKEVSDEFKNEKAWDSNAITPGTPFMDLLAKSLRYWVAQKLNSDPGWAGLEVIISDASVPGEGEHKIMDFIRRQRSHSSHDPNTKHVIYGLDADLIMLSLATHEPHFRVLREDVFAQDKKPRGCHRCGVPGHHSSQCTGKPKEKEGDDGIQKKHSGPKPFIFLDVSILREYLSLELSAPTHSFPFSLERAIDDWIFLIFFVGNDFLPHLPSLEIREGAIDVLMTIWKNGLERMGGYLTDNGKVNLERAQVILEALASREDEIFRKRREAEERQDRNEKRRRIDNGQSSFTNGHDLVEVKSRPETPSRPPPPPQPAQPVAQTQPQPVSAESKELSSMVGSNSSIVANRRAIRMANVSAADMIKAELKAASGQADASTPSSTVAIDTAAKKNAAAAAALKKELMGGGSSTPIEANVEEVVEEQAPKLVAEPALEVQEPVATEALVKMDEDQSSPRGIKRKADDLDSSDQKSAVVNGSPLVDAEADEDDDEDDDEESDEADAFIAGATELVRGQTMKPGKLNVLGNNMVEQEDTVKLWEPGYKERYYRQKFGVELSDLEFRKGVVKSYVEGLCWVLQYYFQGTPSWQWYYPYHFSPFASDFVEVAKLDIEFNLGEPFKPFEQLMGVFPSASRFHLPEPFQPLMSEDDSPIKDFYPEEFDIDMNGKKMIWQGVALLPFIDEKRLLGAMSEKYDQLKEDEIKRNTRGRDTIFVSQDHGLYDYIEDLYGKKRASEPVPLDTKRSKGLSGSVLPDPDCVPGSTFDSPLPSLPDIASDRAIFATYIFPPQKTPHRSALLPGAKPSAGILTGHDRDLVRRGGGGGYNDNNGGFHAQRREQGPGFVKSDDRRRFASGPPSRPPSGGGPYGGYQPAPEPPRYGGGGYAAPPPQAAYGGYAGYAGAAGYGGAPPPPPPAYGSYGGYPQQSPPQAAYGGYGGYGRGPPPPGPPMYGGYGQQPPQQPYGQQGGYGGYNAGPPGYGGYGAGYPPPQGQHRRF